MPGDDAYAVTEALTGELSRKFPRHHELAAVLELRPPLFVHGGMVEVGRSELRTPLPPPLPRRRDPILWPAPWVSGLVIERLLRRRGLEGLGAGPPYCYVGLRENWWRRRLPSSCIVDAGRDRGSGRAARRGFRTLLLPATEGIGSVAERMAPRRASAARSGEAAGGVPIQAGPRPDHRLVLPDPNWTEEVSKPLRESGTQAAPEEPGHLNHAGGGRRKEIVTASSVGPSRLSGKESRTVPRALTGHLS
jgi:hypothetical protein